MQQTVGARVWIALSIVYVVWGSTYLAIRWADATLPPVLMAGSRFLVAGLALGGILWARRGWQVFSSGWRANRNAALCGLLVLFGGNGSVVIAEQRVPSGLTALLVAAVPLWLIVLRRAGGTWVPPLTYVGVLVGVAGVALLFLRSSGGHTDLWYAALVLLASLSWAVGSYLTTRVAVPAEPMALSTIEMLASGIAMIGFAAARGEFGQLEPSEVSLKSWLSLVYLIVFGSLVAFSAYVWVFANGPVSLVSTYAFVNPAVAVVLGVWLAGEQLNGTEILGGLVILAAIVLVLRAEVRIRKPEPEPAVA